jgi:hypothetical protein
MSSTIENPGAYERAIARRIKANAAITRHKAWLNAHADAQRISDWLYSSGEFESRYKCGAVISGFEMHECAMGEKCSGAGAIAHPTTVGMFAGNFGKVLLQLRDALNEWGGLTDKQTDLVRRALARAEERAANAAQRREERMAVDRLSVHVGAIGERRDFVLTVGKVLSFEGQFGVTYINLCKDADGNVVVYKGSNRFEEGQTITVKATVKAHEERDGVKQTLIARPKVGA